MNNYIKEFSGYLGQLGATERDEVVSFYQEYLEDGGFETYDQAVGELGSPKQLARKVLADYSIRLLDGTASQAADPKPQSEVRTIWIIILAILSTPITIPIAVVVLGIMFAVLVSAVAIIFAAVVIVFSILLVAVVAIFFGISLIGTNGWVAMTYLGGGLAAIGAFLILIPALIWLIRGLIRGALSISKWLYAKLSRKNKAEERRDQ
ncbi:DUF1700 domain-containing protein [Secundilactobacillus kimchicus]|uniref:Integral membrane protein n=1 Tax=Secundilactobacillus kimchicus JCM 15530 TaxID=1302272 RepID=A0A0R1HL09_9LACO|nr:DUF1700 domain-containing protein [Secundilactobacillus kimchicus]KRK47381.1 hypothetical protein FC96_GL002500 [Secundilactobacillus kimchicus JCM 15530]